MNYQKTIHMEQRTSGISDEINAGELVMWFENNIVKIKTGNTTRTLDIGVTIEEIQDLLDNTFQDTASIVWTYDDSNDVYRANLNQSLVDKINSALQNGDDITNLSNNAGYETPAQLANRDSANRNRSNHTGTQLASTISDLDQAIANYLDRKPPIQIEYDLNNYSINTSNTNYAIIVDEDYTPLHTGKYKVVANFGHSYDNATDDNIVELLVNDVVYKPMQKEPKDVGGQDGSSGTNQKEIGHFEYIFDTVASTDFNIKFQHRPEANGVESTIKHLDLYVERYL